MFNNLRNEIVELNKDVNNVANSERAKALRKKLITIGLVLAILGFGGVFVCFILFVTVQYVTLINVGIHNTMNIMFQIIFFMFISHFLIYSHLQFRYLTKLK